MSDKPRRHIANARQKETRWGVVITKEHKDSPRKIDAAVAAVLAHDAATAPSETSAEAGTLPTSADVDAAREALVQYATGLPGEADDLRRDLAAFEAAIRAEVRDEYVAAVEFWQGRAEAGRLDVEDVDRLARAMHLARLGPDREEPYCDQPFTEMDFANHVRVAEGVMWAYRMLPKETTND